MLPHGNAGIVIGAVHISCNTISTNVVPMYLATVVSRLVLDTILIGAI
jgi:hypothetical protein